MKTCTTCGKPLSRKNVTGYCARDLLAIRNADPEYRSKAVAAQRLAMASDPEKLEAARQRALNARALPQSVEARRRVTPEQMRELARRKNAAHPAGSDERRRAGARITAVRLADIPPHLRADYRILVRKRMNATEARAAIAEQHEAEIVRFRRSLGEAVEVDPSVYEARLPECPVAATAMLLDVEMDAITSSSRAPVLVDARAVIAVVLRKADHSYPKIGRCLNRDHSAVIHLVETFPKRVARRPELAAIAKRITERLAA